MKEAALAVQAMSACDRLEQGVRDGDKETIATVRDLISRWSGPDYHKVSTLFSLAFRSFMQQCANGKDEDLILAMDGIRLAMELQLHKTFRSRVN